MSIFSKILNKLGFGKDDDDDAAATTSSSSSSSSSSSASGSGLKDKYAQQSSQKATSNKPKPMAMVDVVAKLDGLAAKAGQELNWKVSIVDLMKLLDIDSGYDARKELAEELGCPPDQMDDSARMNVWLHKAVMQKLADNGGNVPAELLDGGDSPKGLA